MTLCESVENLLNYHNTQRKDVIFVMKDIISQMDIITNAKTPVSIVQMYRNAISVRKDTSEVLIKMNMIAFFIYKCFKMFTNKQFVCLECEGRYILNVDGTGCSEPSNLVIIVHQLKKTWKQKKLKDNCLSDMRRTNIAFNIRITKEIICNKNGLWINDEMEQIPVDEETKELICLWNTGSDVSIQFSVWKNDITSMQSDQIQKSFHWRRTRHVNLKSLSNHCVPIQLMT